MEEDTAINPIEGLPKEGQNVEDIHSRIEEVRPRSGSEVSSKTTSDTSDNSWIILDEEQHQGPAASDETVPESESGPTSLQSDGFPISEGRQDQEYHWTSEINSTTDAVEMAAEAVSLLREEDKDSEVTETTSAEDDTEDSEESDDIEVIDDFQLEEENPEEKIFKRKKKRRPICVTRPLSANCKGKRKADLSNLYPDEELPENFAEIQRGQISHIRNQNFNVWLTTLTILFGVLIVGLGLGHFLGWSERLELHEQFDEVREEKLEKLQDSLVSCMTGPEAIGGDDQDLDDVVIRELYLENQELKDQLDLAKNELNAALMDSSNFDSVEDKLEEELRAILRDRINDLLLANADLEREVAKLRYSQPQAQGDKEASEVALKNSLNDVNLENEALRMQIGMARYGVPNMQTEEKMLINRLQTENEELKNEVRKTRYGVPNLQTEEKMLINRLQTENEELKNEVRKIRYASPPAAPQIADYEPSADEAEILVEPQQSTDYEPSADETEILAETQLSTGKMEILAEPQLSAEDEKVPGISIKMSEHQSYGGYSTSEDTDGGYSTSKEDDIEDVYVGEFGEIEIPVHLDHIESEEISLAFDDEESLEAEQEEISSAFEHEENTAAFDEGLNSDDEEDSVFETVVDFMENLEGVDFDGGYDSIVDEVEAFVEDEIEDFIDIEDEQTEEPHINTTSEESPFSFSTLKELFSNSSRLTSTLEKVGKSLDFVLEKTDNILNGKDEQFKKDVKDFVDRFENIVAEKWDEVSAFVDEEIHNSEKAAKEFGKVIGKTVEKMERTVRKLGKNWGQKVGEKISKMEEKLGKILGKFQRKAEKKSRKKKTTKVQDEILPESDGRKDKKFKNWSYGEKKNSTESMDIKENGEGGSSSSSSWRRKGDPGMNNSFWMFNRAEVRDRARKAENEGEWYLERARQRKKFHDFMDADWQLKKAFHKSCDPDREICENLAQLNPAGFNHGLRFHAQDDDEDDDEGFVDEDEEDEEEFGNVIMEGRKRKNNQQKDWKRASDYLKKQKQKKRQKMREKQQKNHDWDNKKSFSRNHNKFKKEKHHEKHRRWSTKSFESSFVDF